MYLTQLLHRGLQCFPTRTALVCGDVRRTYGELNDRVARLAGHLQALGVKPGDRVALLGMNSIESVEIMLASWWVGAIACPVNTRWSLVEIITSLDDCTPGVLFFDDAYAQYACQLGERVASLRHVVRIDNVAPGGPADYNACIASVQAIADGRFGGDHLLALLYTGGTTGRAKGVMLSHRSFWSACMSRLADNDDMARNVCLLSTTLFHVAGLIRVFPTLMAGGTCVILPQFRADEAMRMIEREGVTELAVVPSMLQMILDHPEFSPQRLKSLRRLNYGAAPSARALLQRTAAILPWAGLSQAYGMTESMAVATLSQPQDHTEDCWQNGRATSAGRACTGVDVRIVDEHGNDVPAGQVGEIVLGGAIVSPGYWNRPEETASTFRDGWLFTGDAGSMDADGYLYVVDRIKDMIVTGGENVYSAEVENALAQHPAVSMCSVIGVPSEQWGEAVHAIVVPRQDAQVDEAVLKRHCRELVAHYKVPKSIEFANELPLTPVGKVAKNVLRARHWEGREKAVN